jgi:hypothetical protein
MAFVTVALSFRIEESVTVPLAVSMFAWKSAVLVYVFPLESALGAEAVR